MVLQQGCLGQSQTIPLLGIDCFALTLALNWQVDHLLLHPGSPWGKWSGCSLGCPAWPCLQTSLNGPPGSSWWRHHRQLLPGAVLCKWHYKHSSCHGCLVTEGYPWECHTWWPRCFWGCPGGHSVHFNSETSQSYNISSL